MHRVTNRWLRAGIVGALTCATLAFYERPSAADTSGEYDVKAAFILNFAKFVDWPDTLFTDRSSPLIIAIAGEDPFGSSLEQLVAKKAINSHPLGVRKVSTNGDFTGVNVLYISPSARAQTPAIIKKLVGGSILTVSDMDDFCSMGGIIHLTHQDQRIRFEVNLFAAQHAGLAISSKLLGLARAVYTDKP